MSSAHDVVANDALTHLRRCYPWPKDRPDFDPVDWSLDGGGRWLVTQKIRCQRAKIVLEIGSFLGGSVKSWLDASPDVVVIAVDPWPVDCDLRAYARSCGQSDAVVEQLGRHAGFYQTFLANLWDQRDRVIPVREYSPAVLHQLSAIGLRPDLIYLDSDKVGNEIAICHELFPGVVMTGDDWAWKNEAGEFPIREPVQRFCDQHKRHLKVENATWLIDTEPPSLRFRFRCFRREIRRRRRERRLAIALTKAA